MSRKTFSVQLPPAHGRWDGLFCTTAVLLLILATRPFVEIGLIDDFSYVKTAWDFARTGHFLFNGWATAMLGWQVLWGALFVRLLGDSFFAPRLSILVLACLSVLLLHAILRRGGLTRSNAALGALVVGLSPIFVPLSVTFMTDVSGLFVILLALYCCLRAVASETDCAAMGWIIAGNLAGTAGGTVRQIAWLTVLVMLPSTAWLLRRRRWILQVEGALWGFSLLVIQQSLSWFRRQPFSVPEPLVQGSFHLRSLRELAGTMLAAGLCLAFLLTPVLVIGLRRLSRLRAWGIAALAAATAVGTFVCRFITAHLAERGWMPWTGDLVDRLGVFDFPNAWLIGVSPVSFTLPMRIAASTLVVGVLISFTVVVAQGREAGAPKSQLAQAEGGSEAHLRWLDLLWIVGPFSAAYILLLVPRGIWAEILDRYLLPLLAIAVLLLLRLAEERVGRKTTVEGWSTLAFLAVFSLAGTHDWMAGHRARLQAIVRLHSAGIPDTKIAAGFEVDGLTQILNGRAIIDPRVTYPPEMRALMQGAALREPQGMPPQCESLRNPHTPAVRPHFFLAYQAVPCLVSSKFQEEPYVTWMPPHRRSIRILQLDPQMSSPGTAP